MIMIRCHKRDDRRMCRVLWKGLIYRMGKNGEEPEDTFTEEQTFERGLEERRCIHDALKLTSASTWWIVLCIFWNPHSNNHVVIGKTL